MIEVVAAIKLADRDQLGRHSGQEGRGQRQQRAEREASRERHEGGGEIGPQHVERAMRQIDEVHDAEDQRQAGGEQEQQQTELQAVQTLFEEEEHGDFFLTLAPPMSSWASSTRVIAAKGHV